MELSNHTAKSRGVRCEWLQGAWPVSVCICACCMWEQCVCVCAS